MRTPPAEHSGLQRGVTALALTLFAIGLWALTHRYQDLTGDAELYAMQALAKVHPALGADLYLQNVSQDRYTVFSRGYAVLIAALGIHEAARALFVLWSAWLLVAAWVFVRRTADAASAWAAMVLLMIMVGHYGSYGVFRFSETFLTARTAAEALVVTALACHATGWRLAGLAIAVAALLIHPLIALPGLLLLLCLNAGPRLSAGGALGGLALTLLVTLVALRLRPASGPLTVIDGSWLEVVRERSQFLFLPLWRLPDWKGNLLPFASLALTLLAVDERRVRALASGAMLIGAAGLGVAWVASSLGPVAILIQGQAWRWVWITSFMAIVLLMPTLRALWRDPRCGPVCALILLAGWTCTALDTWIGIALAALLWVARPWITPSISTLLRYAALGLALVLAAWTLANVWTTISGPLPETGRELAVLTYARNVLGLQTIPLALLGGFLWWLSRQRAALWPALTCIPLAALCVVALPGAVRFAPTSDSAADYAAWREVIPPDSNVLVAGEHNAASFIWFTLQRPSYSSIDQSAGVVFSRATAAEVRRRGEVLRPLETPAWRIMSSMSRHAAPGGKPEVKEPALTAANLGAVCADPSLGFVIARESLGFGARRNAARGHYHDWYLYDCRVVRAAGTPA